MFPGEQVCRLRPSPELLCRCHPLAPAADHEGAVVRMDLDDLVEHWTLFDDERELAAGLRGPTRLGFALLLKFCAGADRFPRGRSELAGDAVEFVARQPGVPASDLGFYEWSGHTFEYHRAQVRRTSGSGVQRRGRRQAHRMTGRQRLPGRATRLGRAFRTGATPAGRG